MICVFVLFSVVFLASYRNKSVKVIAEKRHVSFSDFAAWCLDDVWKPKLTVLLTLRVSDCDGVTLQNDARDY